LKKITTRITWDDAATDEPKSYEKHVYIHQDSLHE